MTASKETPASCVADEAVQHSIAQLAKSLADLFAKIPAKTASATAARARADIESALATVESCAAIYATEEYRIRETVKLRSAAEKKASIAQSLDRLNARLAASRERREAITRDVEAQLSKGAE